MPNDFPLKPAVVSGGGEKRAKSSSLRPAWFSLPEPLKYVFDKFPLRTLTSNELPQRAPRLGTSHVLHVFTSPEAALQAQASYNPACLKWQAYLKFSGIDFITTPATNHASPSGALPFLLPRAYSTRPSSPIASSKIAKWTSSQIKTVEDVGGMRLDAYTSLLEHRIRDAWLFTLYLDDANFNSVAYRLYIASASSNSLVQSALSYQLRQAARDELLKHSSIINGDDLYKAAESAFEALASLLGHGDYFFESDSPTLFDASVFAYTHLILDENLGWKTTILGERLRNHTNLVTHRRRLYEQYFSS